MKAQIPVDRLSTLLEAALDLPSVDRAPFLDAACADDPVLRARVAELLARATPTDDFLERAAFDRPTAIPDHPTFKEGDELAGRFRIVRLIGAGGMGEVYEATDLELGSLVALKTIRGHSARDADAIARFRREVLRARRVAHRNVCRVYDLFSHQPAGMEPVRFLTMELLEGVTLAEHLRVRGRLTVDEAEAISTQIAAALDEAHRLHIVHRDLKPGNIMLVPDDGGTRAVVTDFGLALHLADGPVPDPTMTSETRGGTAGYMAPEQRTTGRVDAAADVYAFGVVLHEMLTGGTPAVENAASPVELPARWKEAIDACLETDPRRRPESTSAALRLANALVPATSARYRVAAAVVVTILVGVSLFAWVWRFSNGRQSSASPTLVLTPIVNATGEAELDGLTEVLRHQLTQSLVLKVMETEQVNEVLRQMVQPTATLTVETAREVAWRRSADLIVSGQLARATGGFTLTIRGERRGAQPNIAGPVSMRTFEARDRTELQRIVGEAGRWLRGVTGEAAADIDRANSPVADVTSNSWQAVSLFSRAETLAAQSRRDDALALLAEAVRIDPEFALARMRMGDILMARRQHQQAAEHWNEALRLFDRRQLAPREAYRIRTLYAHDAADYAEAERVSRLWLVLYPNDPKPFFYIARPLLMLGRVAEAIAMLEAAQRLDSYAHYIPAHLAMFHLRAGLLDGAEPHIARLRALEQPAWADALQGQLDFLRGDYLSALARFEALEGASHPGIRSRAPALQAAVLAETGRVEEAIARLERGIASDGQAGLQSAQADKLLAAASLHLRRGRRGACRDLCIQAEQFDQAGDRLTVQGSLLAQAGFLADAERLLGRLDASSTVQAVRRNRHRLRGELLLARGNAKGGWEELQRAAALDAPGVPLEYLARAAVAAGEVGPGLAMYKRLASDPGYFWHYPDLELPGAWSAALATYVRLAARVAPDTDVSAFHRQARALVNPQPATNR